jgi:tRNA nucleotidyltransferase/poly(A) polymerase
MSDYMFMLESHLSPEQNRAVLAVEQAAADAGVRAFLTGGALRDTMGGFPIRDLEFTVEGPTAKLVKFLVLRHGVKATQVDPARRAHALEFPGSVRAEIAIAHTARYPRPGARPVVRAATIHDDLKRRDFTINSVAISLNKASRGLLLDPANGLGDLERRELRANSNHTLHDDPARILRMLRLRARLGFDLNERTQSQYANVREAGLESKIGPDALRAEFFEMANEPNPGGLLEILEREKLTALFSPALAGPKLNSPGFARLLRVRQLVPFGVDFHVENFGLFLHLLEEKLSEKERKDLARRVKLTRAEQEAPRRLEQRARKLERALQSAKLSRASLVFQFLRTTPGEEIIFLMMRTDKRIVHDRIKHHLVKYLEVASEVTDRDLAHLNLQPGTPAFERARIDRINALLDGRIRKPAPPPPPPPQPTSAWARRG